MAKTDMFNFFLPLTKIDKDKRTISGYASTPAIDLDGEVVSLDAVRKALPNYWEWRNIREMHGPSAVGVAKEANVDDKGLFLTAKIVDDDAWKKCVEGVYKGFSVGGKKLTKQGNTITAIDLVEISVVDRPANPECKFEVQKRAKPTNGDAAVLVKAAKPERSPTQTALKKMAQAVEAMTKTVDGDGMSKPAATSSCAKHGVIDCVKCAMKAGKAAKRDADDAAAKLKKKDKKEVVKRAADLGVELPKKFTIRKARKLIKAAQAQQVSDLVAKYSRPVPEISGGSLPSSSSATPSFLVLGADLDKGAGGSSRLRSKDFLELDAIQPREDGLSKSMNSAGSMSYCFDSLRNVQRSLLAESKREGGDKKDKALAEKVGKIASDLAGVIGQKAEHEGAEALNLSDADDQWIRTSLGEDMNMSAKAAKKAAKSATLSAESLMKMIVDAAITKSGGGEMTRLQRVQMARGEIKKAANGVATAMDAIKSAHSMHKTAYLAKQANAGLVKAGKKKPAKDDDDDDFDHQDAMEKLQKAYGELEKVTTFSKSARNQLKKAASRADQGGNTNVNDESMWFKPVDGVTALSSNDLATAGPGGSGSGSVPPLYPNDGSTYPGKMAKRIRAMAKAGTLTADVAEILAEAAHMEGANEALSRLPAGPAHGRRPVTFDMTKFGSYSENDTERRQNSETMFKGVNPADLASDDEQSRRAAVGKVVTNMITGGMGKSVFDASFRGTAGLDRQAA